MIHYRFSRRSLARLKTCHPVLQTLFERAIVGSPIDIIVLEGHRSNARQDKLFAEGASKLRGGRSKHNTTPSLAVDVAPWLNGRVSWDWDDYDPLSAHIKACWEKMPEGVLAKWSLVWGGDWVRFPDGPHWELRAR